MSSFPLDCRSVTRLVLERQHRPLGLVERTGVGLHLGICRGCRRFTRQMTLMDRALAAWKRDGEDDGPAS